MVLYATEPIRSLFNDEDRRVASESLGEQRAEVEHRREAAEAAAVEDDQRIVVMVAAKRRAEGKPWTAEIEAEMLAKRAADRQVRP